MSKSVGSFELQTGDRRVSSKTSDEKIINNKWQYFIDIHDWIKMNLFISE